MVVVVIDFDDFVGVCVGCGVVDVGFWCIGGDLVCDWYGCFWWYVDGYCVGCVFCVVVLCVGVGYVLLVLVVVMILGRVR